MSIYPVYIVTDDREGARQPIYLRVYVYNIIDIGFASLSLFCVSPSLKNVVDDAELPVQWKPSNPPLHVPSHPIWKLGDIVSFFFSLGKAEDGEGEKKDTLQV